MNIGCDIVENERLKNKNQRFIDFCLTKNEQNEYKRYGLKYLCGHFAVKEAIMKALPETKNYNFLNFEILHREDGSPYVKNREDINKYFS